MVIKKIELLKKMRISLIKITKELEHLFPIDSDEVTQLIDTQQKDIDSLCFRFEKLQYFLGKKMLDDFLKSLGEFSEKQSIIDKLNVLEKLGFIEDAQEWITINNTQNFIAHEYPDNTKGACESLNTIFYYSKYLIDLSEKMIIVIEDQINKNQQKG